MPDHDTEHVKRWRARMLERHHTEQVRQRIDRATLSWRSTFRVGLAMTLTGLAFGYATLAMQQCSGLYDARDQPSSAAGGAGTGGAQDSASSPHPGQ